MGVTNVLMAGVGGQGIILASNVLAKTAAAEGLDVKKSDVHGMAQRGGSVTSHVRFGDKVHSPLIPDGEADILMASEFLEGLRWMGQMKKGGRAVVSTQRVHPPSVSRGQEPYPPDILDRIRERDPECVSLACLELAKQAGNSKTATVVLLGAVSSLLPFKLETWLDILKREAPKKAVEVNLLAFRSGRDSVS